jgi:energy-coupling factor transporter ATP-binding protein EcfA2
MSLLVKVENFQSIENLTIEIDGFTALTGRSNIGKSALVRAIRAALTNADGTYFVRHTPACREEGKSDKKCKCFSRVQLTSEGFDLTWEKGASISRYRVNGQEYDRPGRGNLDFLDALGLEPVRVGVNTTFIQYAQQFKPIFMLEESGSVVAESIADVSKLARVSGAIKLAEKVRRDLQATRKTREKDLQVVGTSLLHYVQFDTFDAQVSKVEGVSSEVETAGADLALVTSFVSKARDNQARRQDLQGMLAAVVEEDVTRDAYEEWATLREFVSEAIDLKKRVAHLSPVNSLTVPELNFNSSGLRKVAGFIVRLSALKSSSSRLVGKFEVPDLVPLALGPVRTLQTLQKKHSKLLEDLSKLSKEHSEVCADYSVVEAEIAALPRCESCQQVILGEAH